ncbi:MAG: hypothetical protein KKG33_11645 [candidate division Zixibacteria bacterium]|nr:hypothetical protein [candidate division Zixibacteria bacterium]MBU1472101.1 hypothetical protein [candidate division Zixibacteria bacterium]MBU2626201.1 hypothetical protein [candidate division Zixibacteria bacterium]
MHSINVAEPKNRVRNLLIADSVDLNEIGCSDSDNEPALNRYRIVLNCQSQRKHISLHRKITVGFETD